jgi:ribonuclease HI
MSFPFILYILYFDGSSKNNPGRGGAGAVLYQKNDKDTEIFALSHFEALKSLY